VPLALEVIEPERMADEYRAPYGTLIGTLRLGVEVDEFGRPLAFWLRTQHPGELRYDALSLDRLMRVPAEQMMHLAVVDRWPQTRGEPWLHAAARRLNDMDGYSEAEIVAARGSASYMATIETPEGSGTPQQLDTDLDETDPEFELAPGLVKRLGQGEKLNFVAPNRPNPNMDPFMRLMLREVAAGASVSYESISRDYSQSNYSSSRLALLEDRDVWRALQQWFIRSFREPLHREWLQRPCSRGAIPGLDIVDYASNPRKYEAVSFKPRGWSWVDPNRKKS
jgi:lambda family phage portal protein